VAPGRQDHMQVKKQEQGTEVRHPSEAEQPPPEGAVP
jgi:hypothetical protein